MRNLKFIFSALIVIVYISCKKPFVPDLDLADQDFLIVEGFINTGADSTIFKLSHTVRLQDSVGSKPITGASVVVESDANDSYSLQEKPNGLYVSPNLNLAQTKKYRVRIKIGSSEYLSDFVESKISPAITDLSFKVDPDRVSILASTQDPTNSSRYYKWDYDETWEIHADYFSSYKWNGTKVVPRNLVDDQIFVCYPTYRSSTILLNNTLRLANDVMANQPILQIDKRDDRTYYQYSVLLKQRVLTKEGYEFWENLKRTTETLGSIFDAQPTNITGNIRNVARPDEPVIGFISAGTVSYRRLTFYKADVPAEWERESLNRCSFYLAFENEPVPEAPPSSPRPFVYGPDYYISGAAIPLSLERGTPAQPVAYSAVSSVCADCTSRGTNIKPAYW